MTQNEFGQEQEWAQRQTDRPSTNSCQPNGSAQNVASGFDRPLSGPGGTVERDPGPGHLHTWMTMTQGTAANFDGLDAADASPKEEEDPGGGHSEY